MLGLLACEKLVHSPKSVIRAFSTYLKRASRGADAEPLAPKTEPVVLYLDKCLTGCPYIPVRNFFVKTSQRSHRTRLFPTKDTKSDEEALMDIGRKRASTGLRHALNSTRTLLY